jgi:hypothetical protein
MFLFSGADSFPRIVRVYFLRTDLSLLFASQLCFCSVPVCDKVFRSQVTFPDLWQFTFLPFNLCRRFETWSYFLFDLVFIFGLSPVCLQRSSSRLLSGSYFLGFFLPFFFPFGLCLCFMDFSSITRVSFCLFLFQMLFV